MTSTHDTPHPRRERGTPPDAPHADPPHAPADERGVDPPPANPHMPPRPGKDERRNRSI